MQISDIDSLDEDCNSGKHPWWMENVLEVVVQIGKACSMGQEQHAKNLEQSAGIATEVAKTGKSIVDMDVSGKTRFSL